MKKFFSIIALLLAISVLFVFGCKDPEVPVEPPGGTEAPEKPGDNTETGENQPGDTGTGGNQSGDTGTGGNQPGDTGTGGNQPGDTETGENQPGDNSGTGGNQPGDTGTGGNQPGDNTESGGNQSGDNTGDSDDSDDVLVANSITLTVSSGLVYVGETATITSSVTLSDGSTVNPEITTTGKSTVSGNVLTANSVGTETITATYEGLSTSVEITIKEKISGSIIVHAKYPYIWYWDTNADGQLGNMKAEDDGWYYYTFDKSTINVIFRPYGGDDWNGKTGDLTNITTGEWWYNGSSMVSSAPNNYPSVSADPVTSTENASGSGNDSSDDNQDSGDINQGGSSGDNNDDNENQGGSSGGSTGGESSDPIVTDYYWTNKDGAVGTNKTISSWSDWTEADKIAQGAANDDPRVFCWWSMHEVQTDAYALYAAYDDTNLYVMVELTNVQDIVAPQNDYPISDNGQYWNRGTPFFLAFETGKGTGGNGSMISGADPYVWNSAVKFGSNNVDTMFVCHSNPSKGTPGVFYTNSDGLFSYTGDLCKTFPATGVEVTWNGGANKTQGIVSKNIYGIKEVGGDQGRSIENIETDTYVDFNTLGHDTNLDLKWQMKIPLTALNVTKSYLEANGIGVMFVISDGASGMDCLPWDSTMIDNADKPYSKDESTSAEKEDEDIITVPFARIGKM